MFLQYEIDSNRQHDRRSIFGPTCQVGCQVKSLYLEQSATVIWAVTHIQRWRAAEKASAI